MQFCIYCAESDRFLKVLSMSKKIVNQCLIKRLFFNTGLWYAPAFFGCYFQNWTCVLLEERRVCATVLCLQFLIERLNIGPWASESKQLNFEDNSWGFSKLSSILLILKKHKKHIICANAQYNVIRIQTSTYLIFYERIWTI